MQSNDNMSIEETKNNELKSFQDGSIYLNHE
jgi:hypothetical protein